MSTVMVTLDVVLENNCCLVVLPLDMTVTPVVLVVVVVLIWLPDELLLELVYGVTAVAVLRLNSFLPWDFCLVVPNDLNAGGVTMKLGNWMPCFFMVDKY
jgi:hypothetical protein